MTYGVDDVSYTVDVPGWQPQLILGQTSSLGTRGADDGSFTLDLTGPAAGNGRGRLAKGQLAIEVLRFSDGSPLTGTAQSLADGGVGVFSQLKLADGGARGTTTLYIVPVGSPQPDRAIVFDDTAPEWSIFGPYKASVNAPAGLFRYDIVVSDAKSYLQSASVSKLSLMGPSGGIGVKVVATSQAIDALYTSKVFTIEAQLPLDNSGQVRSGSYVLSDEISATDIAGNVLTASPDLNLSTFATSTWSSPVMPSDVPVPGFSITAIPSSGGPVYLSRKGDTLLVNSWGAQNTADYRTGWMSVPVGSTSPVHLSTAFRPDETISRVQWFTGDGGALITGTGGTRVVLQSDSISTRRVTLPSDIGNKFDVISSDDGKLLIAASDGNGITFPQLPELRRLWIAPIDGAFSEVSLADDPTATGDNRGILSREFQQEPTQGSLIPQGFKTDGGAASIAESLVSLLFNRQLRVFPADDKGSYHVYLRSNDGFKHAELQAKNGEYSVSRPTLVITGNTVSVPSQTSVRVLTSAFWMTWLADGSLVSTLLTRTGTTWVTKLYHVMTLGKRPVVFVPGIVGSWPKRGEYNNWLMNLGVAPSTLEIDPLAKTYNDILASLRQHGYEEGKDLFPTPYDWRLPLAPDDGTADGRIRGLTADALIDNTFSYGVDYLGNSLSRAMTAWDQMHQHPLDAVDVVAHSMGGLVTRSYVQSDAYGSATSTGVKLPILNEFVEMATPHQGASKSWNLINGNFIADPVYQIVFAGIIFDAYNRLFTKANRYQQITRPAPLLPITADLIRQNAKLPQYAQLATTRSPTGVPPDESQMALVGAFMELYVPGGVALTPIYDFMFADGSPGAWREAVAPGDGGTLQFRNLNTDPARRNYLLLDLNGGLPIHFNPTTAEWEVFDSYDEKTNKWRNMLGSQTSTTDMNSFANLARSTIIASVDLPTLSVTRALVGPRQRNGEPPPVGSLDPMPRPIKPADNRVRQPLDGEVWFMDIYPITPASDADVFPEEGYKALQRSLALGNLSMALGDATVPGVSSVNPFIHDDRVARFYLQQQADHGGIMANADAEVVALRMLGISVDRDKISTGSQSVLWRGVREVIGILMDPVEAIVSDDQGRRLGWSATTGVVAEIPGSLYFGDSEGIGFLFNSSATRLALSLNIKSLDGSPMVRVSTFRAGETSGVRVLDGPLPAGQSRVISLTPQGTAGTPTIADIATLPNGLRRNPLTITFEQLLSATQASDPDATPVQLRIGSVLSGQLRSNGTPVASGITIVGPGDTLDWTPAGKATGVVDAFSVAAVSAGDVSESECTVRVNLRTSNRKPVIAQIATLSGADAGGTFTFVLPPLLSSATDADGDPLTYFLTAGPNTGTLTRNGVTVPKGQTRLLPSDTLTFTPGAGQKNVIPVFTFIASDGVSRSSGATVKLKVNVAPAVRAPKDMKGSSNGAPVVLSYTALTKAIAASDANKDSISYRIESVGSGVLQIGGTDVIPGQSVLGPGMSLSWTPPTSATGRLSAFTLRAFDGRLFSNPITVNVVYPG